MEVSVREVFNGCVPGEFTERTVRLLFTDYERASRVAEELSARPEGHDLLPHLRRAFIEQDLRALAQRFAGVTASPELNGSRNSYHTKVVMGSVVLTESCVDSPQSLPRRAEFRLGYSQLQWALFPFDELETPLTPYVYAVLLHGPDPRNPSRPSFAHIAFPDTAGEGCLDRIDIFARHESLVRSLSGDRTEVILAPKPALRPEVRRAMERDA